MINTFLIIYLIIAVILLIYLSIKLFLFHHRKIENLIVYDNDIYIKINGSTFFNIKRKTGEIVTVMKENIINTVSGCPMYLFRPFQTTSDIRN